jgi:2-dehydro-3-deoxyphosphogalactonate aldolase
MLVDKFGDEYLIGAGTVTTVEEAEAVIKTGAKLIVSPNCNTDVIKCGVAAGCTVLPGVLTPSEAFDALQAGASGLKIFPANVLGTSGLKALMSVLPKNTLCYPVGGVSADPKSMSPYLALGAAGFGIGSALYTPNMTTAEVASNARQFVDSFMQASASL